MTDFAASPIARVSDVFTLVGSRLIPTLLFTTMSTVSVLGVGHSPSASAAAFHALSATLWGLFIVLINIRPAPLRRNRSPVGVAVALVSQLAVRRLMGVVQRFPGHSTEVVDNLVFEDANHPPPFR